MVRVASLQELRKEFTYWIEDEATIGVKPDLSFVGVRLFGRLFLLSFRSLEWLSIE